MPKILVLGASGMAGHVVATHFAENSSYEVATLSARNRFDRNTALIDVTDASTLDPYLDSHKFDVVINCAGVLVKDSERRKDLAAYVNAYFPHKLEQRYAESSTQVIHLSTDCVFSGQGAPYSESSWPDGPLFYDRSKALGEILNAKDLTFRMSIVGPDSQATGIGLFNWFYTQTGTVSGYTTATWNGVTTVVLARAIEAAIEQNLTGLYHLVPDANISKFELLHLFKAAFRRDDITVVPTEAAAVDKTLVNTRSDFEFAVPAYPEMIREMRDWIAAHHDLYPHYSRKPVGS